MAKQDPRIIQFQDFKNRVAAVHTVTEQINSEVERLDKARNEANAAFYTSPNLDNFKAYMAAKQAAIDAQQAQKDLSALGVATELAKTEEATEAILAGLSASHEELCSKIEEANGKLSKPLEELGIKSSQEHPAISEMRERKARLESAIATCNGILNGEAIQATPWVDFRHLVQA